MRRAPGGVAPWPFSKLGYDGRLMNRVSRILSLCALAALPFSGCSEKNAEPVAEESEEALAPEERIATAPESASAPSPSTEPAPASEAPAPVDAAPAAEPAPVGAGPSSAPPMDQFASEQKAFEDWCKRYFLDPNDPAMLDADNDGDGFPNREEFVGSSDPLNPNSRPGIHAEMRLKTYNEVRLPVMLDEVKGDKAFLKQLEGGEEKPEVVKTGDTVRGMRVGRVVTRRETDKAGNPIDVSRVTLEDESTKERVTLVKGMPARTSATHAVLVSPDGKTSITVKQGETFEWPGATGAPSAHFTVVDMSDDQVVVQEVETQRMWTIPKR
jgi:hypothetical protein